MSSSMSSLAPSQALFDASRKGDLAGVNRALRNAADPRVAFDYVDDFGSKAKNSSFHVAKCTQYSQIIMIIDLITN